jgi:hypothetical protein
MSNWQFPPTKYVDTHKFMKNLSPKLSDYPKLRMPTVHVEQIMMKAPLQKMQLLRVQVPVQIEQVCISSKFTLPGASRFNGHCISIYLSCTLSTILLFSNELSLPIYIIFYTTLNPTAYNISR